MPAVWLTSSWQDYGTLTWIGLAPDWGSVVQLTGPADYPIKNQATRVAWRLPALPLEEVIRGYGSQSHICSCILGLQEMALFNTMRLLWKNGW